MLKRTSVLVLLAVSLFCAGDLAVAAESRVLSAFLTARALDEPWPNGVPIRLCAIRVQFDEDAIDGTTGNGLMGSWFPDTLHIDPLPHDKPYFEDHLAFLRHYYETASKGNVTFSTLDVYPADVNGVYQLDAPMWHYNYNTTEELLNERLVELFAQAVQLADADVDFTNYDAILIFHAGVGKDFGFGYDFTPFDIPSAYINEADLLSFPGSIPAGVTRGLILPEGENQQEALDFGVELSLNGIMVKLFGNWLGMPDLFNTQTGLSGVGRWGMMDQGSGNLGALVPALPDAWSRVFMGWEDAGYVFPNADTAAVIITHALQRFNPASTGGEIIKIPVTQREYYLLENRDADADSLGHVSLFDRDGREMQVATDGTVSISAGFQSAVRASHYDFGIPGSGILIWHIDEDVIEANLETNSVNANPDHRGVDLVEADGAQDIGEEYGFASAGSGAELGIQEDAWYLGNEAYRAANGGALLIRFSDRSLPSARLYDGAYTYLELTNFSAVSDSMTFRARSTTIMPGYPVSVPAVEFPQWSVADLNGDGVREVITLADSRIDVFNMSGQQVGTIQIAEDQDLPRAYNTGYDLDGDGREELPLGGENAVLLRMVDSTLTLTVGPRHEDIHSDVYPARTIEGTPVLLERRIHVFVIYSLSLDSLYSFTVPGTEFGGVNVVNIESLPSTQFALVAEASVHAIELRDAMPVQLWQIDVAADGFASVVAEPDLRTVFINNYGYVRADDGTLLCSTDDCDWPHIDWDGDGIPEGGGRFGRNEVPTENPLHYGGQAAWTDFDVDGRPDQLTLSEIELGPGSFGAPTRMHVARHDGALFPGFPLAASALDPNAMNGLDMTPDNSLYFVSMYGQSGDYRLALNKFPITAGSGERFPYTEDVRIINVGPLNPQVHARADWLYCWPNPTSDESHIRITLSYAAHANVKVFDIAGRQVAELSGASTLPGPFEVLWDVSNVESGVYIGQVTTKGDGGEEQAQVKIAVVR